MSFSELLFASLSLDTSHPLAAQKTSWNPAGVARLTQMGENKSAR